MPLRGRQPTTGLLSGQRCGLESPLWAGFCGVRSRRTTRSPAARDLSPSRMHEELFELLAEANRVRGKRLARAAPRSHVFSISLVRNGYPFRTPVDPLWRYQE